MKALDFDWKPLALVPLLAVLVFPFIGSGSTWVTLTLAGLAMGMIIFVIASGLTLVFGLMDVLNFGHGVFIALGAFVATSVLGSMGDYTGSSSLWVNFLAVLPAMVVAMLVAGAVGLAFEALGGGQDVVVGREGLHGEILRHPRAGAGVVGSRTRRGRRRRLCGSGRGPGRDGGCQQRIVDHPTGELPAARRAGPLTGSTRPPVPGMRQYADGGVNGGVISCE